MRSRSPQSTVLADRQLQHIMLAELAAVKEAADRALMHHGDAVADADHLLHVAGDHQDGDAGVGERAHQLVDLALGADVDAARRLVEDHDLRGCIDSHLASTTFC